MTLDLSIAMPVAMPMPLNINEIFFSIQGESIHAGRPCVFVRLTGCNLRCSYCDTTYAYDGGDDFEIDEIVGRIREYPCRLVEVTGGEPLLQAETPRLITALLDAGHEVLLETNGSLDIRAVDPRCVCIVDMKCPSSGESARNDLRNLTYLRPPDQVKFVIGDREDYLFANELCRQIDPTLPAGHVLYSPADGKLTPEHLARWILNDGLDVRLHLRLHRIVWPAIQKGV